MRWATLLLTLILTTTCNLDAGRRRQVGGTFIATAYSQKGITADGDHTQAGIVAADPKVLPLGSKIQVSGCGPYSGVYVVSDTGSKIHGRKIDLFIRNHAEARRFGKKRVRVKVIELARR